MTSRISFSLVLLFGLLGCADRNNPDPLHFPQQAAAVNLEKQNELLKQHIELQKEQNVQLKRIADALEQRAKTGESR